MDNNPNRHLPHQESMSSCHNCGHELKFFPIFGTELKQNAFAVIEDIRKQNEINIEQIGHDLIGVGVEGNENVIGYNNRKIESNLTKVVSDYNNDKLYQLFWIRISSWYWGYDVEILENMGEV